MEAIGDNTTNYLCVPWQTGPLPWDWVRGASPSFQGNTNLTLHLSKYIMERDCAFYEQSLT